MCRRLCTQLLTLMYQEKSYETSKVDFLNFYGKTKDIRLKGRGYIRIRKKVDLGVVDFELVIKALRLVGAKAFLFHEWFSKGIRTITDLIDNEGHVLSFVDFKPKYYLKKINVLHSYEDMSAILHHLLMK